HSAKGLEWDTVFIIHLVEGKFPSAQASSEEELEEERRLFYVASTRAKQNLFYTYPRRVQGHDRFASFGMVSSFLDNLPPDLLQSGRAGNTYVQAEPLEVSKNTKQFTSPTAGNKDMTLFQEGVQVLHPFFGQGKVEALKGARTVEVFFPRHGKKTLHLDYARLEVVS
ncbi:MAG: ATP-binding domain-containing protein, partial [Desulfobulbaceae bacterium]|nr:ATP-binding domain-containing protein [Desulfobulbaceae bacterium]